MQPLRSLLFLFCFTIYAVAVSAQGSIFMQITDGGTIPGEVTQPGFIGWTEVTNFNAGSTSQVTLGGGGGAAAPVTKCFTISMFQDKAAYHLKKEMYTGSSMSKVELVFATATSGGSFATYYRVLMENVYVTAIEEAGNQDGPIIMNVSFTPSRFRYTYIPLSPGGNPGTPVIFGWDVVQNVAWN